MATFASRLEELRRNRNWSKAQMYRTMDIAPGTLTNYLIGKNSPNIDTVRAYAERLGVSVAWLAGEETPTAKEIIIPETASYSDIIQIMIQLMSIKELGFEYNFREGMAGGEVVIPDEFQITTANGIIANYFKTYSKMQAISNQGLITESEFLEFMDSQLEKLDNKKIIDSREGND